MVFSIFAAKNNYIDSSPQSILEYFYCYPLKTLYSRSKLCLLPVQSSQRQASTELLPVSVDLQIILDVSYQWNETVCGLCEGFLSISIIFSKFIHVATYNSDFYCENTSPYGCTFYVAMYQSKDVNACSFNYSSLLPLPLLRLTGSQGTMGGILLLANWTAQLTFSTRG